MSERTRGPWSIGYGAMDQDDYFTIVDGDHHVIAEYARAAHRDPVSQAEMVGNANLIAAAPTMLAELRDTAAWLDERAAVATKRGHTDEAARIQARAYLLRQLVAHIMEGCS